MEKTSIGLNENVAGLLCYVLGWISGLVFLLIESENKFVRFHALQSIIVFGALTVIQIILGWIPNSLSFLILCWVGFVFTSPAVSIYGTSVRCINITSFGFLSFICLIASIKGRLSMSPLVPPTSTIAISHLLFSPAFCI